MIGIGMPISHSKSPLPILFLQADFGVAEQTAEQRKGSLLMRCNFPQPLRRLVRSILCEAKEDAYEKACDWHDCSGDIDGGSAGNGASRDRRPGRWRTRRRRSLGPWSPLRMGPWQPSRMEQLCVR